MVTARIGRYELKRLLGRGGMAKVFLAFDPDIKRDVAVKVLPRQLTVDPSFRARFRREAESLGRLEHPYIIPIYDFGVHLDRPYLVMRYMPGGSLAGRMARGPVSLGEVAPIIARLAAALDAAHQRGMVHRDLKPGNVLFDQWGGAYLSLYQLALR